MKSYWIDQHRLKNAEDLKDVLARHHNIKLVLFGHVHQDSCNEWHGIYFLSTPSTSVQFKPKSEDFALDQATQVIVYYICNKMVSLIPILNGWD